MEAIKDTIQNVMQTWEKKKTSQHNPEVLLRKIFSARELKHIKFHYLRKGILGIKVESSSWLYHLSLKKEDFIQKLRQKTPEIKDIRFHIGEVN